ncbi:MAG: endonuclease/exonuclease/phosphatase family protein, partial [Pseudomonadota bacterium]
MTDIRVTTFNASLNRSTEGELAAQLADPGLASEAQLANLTGAAETIQRLNPDVLLVNEFDVDLTGQAAQDFQDNFLSVGQNGADPIDFPYVYVADSNTGRLTGFDKNNDGIVATEADLGSFTYANDSHGFGQFPGQFGYVIYSKYPILTEEIRTFQDFLWADMPGALLFDTEMGRPLFDPERPFDAEDPNNEDTSFFTEEEANGFFLSAKNHVDLPVDVNGETVHILAAHPTPPVFDGPEDLNGKLNHDEIRFWTDYVNGEDYIYDDEGVTGGLEEGARFVIVGDYNADPNDGDSVPGAADQFLQDPLIDTTITPTSEGAVAATERQGADNETHVSDPAADTADFGESPFGPGNIRVDYALPSRSG